MRTRTSLAAAALAATVTTTFIVPASAQDSSQPDNSLSSTTNQDSTDNTGCIAVGLAAGLPLALLVPAGIGAALNIPGLNGLARFNTELQRQIGLFDPRIAAAVDQNKDILNGAVGLLGLGLGAAAAFYLLQNCGFEGGSSTEGSSTGDLSSDLSSKITEQLNLKIPYELTENEPLPFPIPLAEINVDGYTIVEVVDGVPDGLTYDAETNTISGTPTKAGDFPLTLKVRKGDGPVLTVTATLTVKPAEVIVPDPVDPDPEPVDPDPDPEPVDPDPEPVDPDPEPEPEPVITVDDFVLIKGGTPTTIPVAAPGTQCTASGLPNGLTYNAETGALEGTIAKLPTGGLFSSGDGGKTFTVTLTCGEASKEFTLQQHDYIRQPAAAVGNFTAFQRLGITEATFTFAADASIYDGQWPDANPIDNRTVTVTKNADGTWSQDPDAFFSTAYDEAEFTVEAKDAAGKTFTGTGAFGEQLTLR